MKCVVLDWTKYVSHVPSLMINTLYLILSVEDYSTKFNIPFYFVAMQRQRKFTLKGESGRK